MTLLSFLLTLEDTISSCNTCQTTLHVYYLILRTNSFIDQHSQIYTCLPLRCDGSSYDVNIFPSRNTDLRRPRSYYSFWRSSCDYNLGYVTALLPAFWNIPVVWSNVTVPDVDIALDRHTGASQTRNTLGI